jgi:uncharacterized phage protein (TIGR02218 family)
MKVIPSALQAKLDSGVTTLCRCWKITRRDGGIQGFTDHDTDLVREGVTYRANTGLDGADATQSFGLSVDGSEVSGALTSETLNENDLAAGLYDAAAIETWLVDWSEPSLAVLLSKGVLGEVRREGGAFNAEIRSLSHRLAEQSGRLYTASCAADLGDARCGVDLTDPRFRGSGTVAAVLATSRVRVTGLDPFDAGWFTGGRLTFTSGANAGQAVEVKQHRTDGSAVILDLWQAMPEPIAEGDAFTVTAGCDKRFETCVTRFANALNFRGFPHIPGNDFVLRYPVQGEPGNDGGSLQS